ncbi:hypothetical protein ALC57_10801, partial [Trachymyrmex cornetzi]
NAPKIRRACQGRHPSFRLSPTKRVLHCVRSYVNYVQSGSFSRENEEDFGRESGRIEGYRIAPLARSTPNRYMYTRLLHTIIIHLGCVRKHHPSASAYRFILVVYSMLNKDKMIHGDDKGLLISQQERAALLFGTLRGRINTALTSRLRDYPNYSSAWDLMQVRTLRLSTFLLLANPPRTTFATRTLQIPESVGPPVTAP